MPLARILASQQDDAANLCEQLHKLGYVVEVVSPSTAPQGEADLEIVLDRVSASEALAYAAQRSKDLQCDVLIAPDALPELKGVAEVNEEEVLAPAWEPAPALDTPAWHDDADEHWNEPNFFPDLEPVELASEIPAEEATLPIFREDTTSEPELPATDLRTMAVENAQAEHQRPALVYLKGGLAELAAIMSSWAIAVLRTVAGMRPPLASTWESVRSFIRNLLAWFASEQRQLRAALQEYWHEQRDARQVRREAALQRRAAAQRQREAEEAARHAEMQARAQQNVIAWTRTAQESQPLSTPAKPGVLTARPGIPPVLEMPSLVPPPAPSLASAETQPYTGGSQFPGSSSLPEPSVWIAPELQAATLASRQAETPSRTAHAGSADLRRWNAGSTTRETVNSGTVQPGLREIQWRRAAAISAALALVLTVGFAIGMRRDASSLLPVAESSRALSAPMTMGQSAAPTPAAKASSRAGATGDPIASEISNGRALSDSKAVSAPDVLAKSPQPRRAPQRQPAVVRADVSVQHFGPEVVVRHFEQKPAPKPQSERKNGVVYYSDLE